MVDLMAAALTHRSPDGQVVLVDDLRSPRVDNALQDVINSLRNLGRDRLELTLHPRVRRPRPAKGWRRYVRRQKALGLWP